MIQACLCAWYLTEHIVYYAVQLRIWKQPAPFTKMPWRGTCVHVEDDLSGIHFSYWVGATLKDGWASMKEVINNMGLNLAPERCYSKLLHFSPVHRHKNARKCVRMHCTGSTVAPDHRTYKPPTPTSSLSPRITQRPVPQPYPGGWRHCCTCPDTAMMTE